MYYFYNQKPPPIKCYPEIPKLVVEYLLLSSQVVSDSLATPWNVACQAPLFMGFPRQEHWRGLPLPSLEDLPYPGIKLASPALLDGFFTTESTRELVVEYMRFQIKHCMNGVYCIADVKQAPLKFQYTLLWADV